MRRQFWIAVATVTFSGALFAVGELPHDAVQRYEAEFAAQRWDQAYEQARMIVDHLESASDSSPFPLVEAYSRLGLVQNLLKDFQGSESSYRKAAQLAATHGGDSDSRAITPLRGLSFALVAQGKHREASIHGERAKRNTDGMATPQETAPTAANQSATGRREP